MDKNKKIKSEISGENQVTLVHPDAYHKGDVIELTCDKPGFYEVCFEDTMQRAIVYIKDGVSRFRIPYGIRERIGFSPRAFKGKMHLITASVANPEFVTARRNLALNPFDAHGETGMYPHVCANVETRNESIFAAKNAIDGIHANHNHYPYPFLSWGINKDPNAELTLEFGVPVNLDTITLVLRADFPHDNYWVSATMEFSDGSNEIVSLTKTPSPQSFEFNKKNITWLKLKKLVKSDDPSEFPALTQIEAWGKIAITGNL